MNRFSEIYRGLLFACLNGVYELNQRTGNRIVMMPEGASFAVDLNDRMLPTCGMRLTRPHIAAAEVAWCFLGHNHIDWLRKHTKVWDAFADQVDCAKCGGSGLSETLNMQSDCNECGSTGKTYWLDASYGYRWRVKFGIDQLQTGINRLKADPTDRRVWISSWDPTSIGDLVCGGQKTVPCPVGFTLSVSGGRLNSTLMIRSSDLYMGLPYDVMRHALVMDSVAASLDVQLGYMRITLAHPHIYERQIPIVVDMLEKIMIEPPLTMPEWPVDEVVERPDAFVKMFEYRAGLETWPAFNPKSEVVR